MTARRKILRGARGARAATAPLPRVPLTEDDATFAEAAKLGPKLIRLHTYAERFHGDGRGDEIPQGAAKIIKGVSDDPAKSRNLRLRPCHTRDHRGLLELFWVLEATLAMELELERAPDKVVAGPCFRVAELPSPKPIERKAPGAVGAAGGLPESIGVEDEDTGDYEDDD